MLLEVYQLFSTEENIMKLIFENSEKQLEWVSVDSEFFR